MLIVHNTKLFFTHTIEEVKTVNFLVLSISIIRKIASVLFVFISQSIELNF